MAQERARGLLRLVLEARLLGALEIDARTVEQLHHLHVVLEVRAGGVAPRVAAASVLLAEEPGEVRPVLAGEAPLLADAAVPQLRERLGHLDTEAVEQQVV